MKQVRISLLAAMALSLVVLSGTAWAQALALAKATFSPGEQIKVSFAAPEGFADNAWVGIIPSSVPHGSESQNDQHDLVYEYLQRRTAGTIVFQAPASPGSYDVRMHDTDDNGREVASVTFNVVAGTNISTVMPDKTAYAPGEQIKVSFAAPASFADNAWVGIIPSSVPHGSESQNDQHDLVYEYLKHRTAGTILFQAPASPGSYDVRMHDTDDNGREVASATFNVMAGGEALPAVMLDKTAYAPGEQIKVSFTAPAAFADNAWVGIIPSSMPHGSEAQNDQHDLVYEYLQRRTAGTIVFQAPVSPGSYDVRMHDTDDNGREVASVTFAVK